MKQKTMKVLPAAVALALLGAAGAASAEGFSYGGYFRAGPQFGAAKGHNRTCFQAPGADWKWRLGNECDYYGEFGLNYGIGKDDGPNFQVHWMPNTYTGGVSDASSLGGGVNPNAPVHTEQFYVEAKNMDIAPNTTFWAGTRFYGRTDVHMVDTFFVNMSGTGGGADINLGGPVLGLGVFRNDAQGAVTTSGGASSTGSPGTRLNADLHDIPGFGPNGKLRATFAYTKGDFSTGTSGEAVSLQSTFDIPAISASNILWLQYSQGSAYLNCGFGGLSDPSSVKHTRIVESLSKTTGPLTYQGLLAYTENKSTAGKSKFTSLGGRLKYAITNNFSFQGELGLDQVKPAGGGSTTNMQKLTLAPTVTIGPDYYSRPEIRLYVTTAHWNTATNLASGATGYGDLGNKTNGTTYGIQFEAWW